MKQSIHIFQREPVWNHHSSVPADSCHISECSLCGWMTAVNNWHTQVSFIPCLWHYPKWQQLEPGTEFGQRRRMEMNVGQKWKKRNSLPPLPAATATGTVIQQGASSSERTVTQQGVSGKIVIQQGASSERTVIQQGASSERTVIQQGASSERTVTQEGVSSERTVIQEGASSERTVIQHGASSDRTVIQLGHHQWGQSFN